MTRGDRNRKWARSGRRAFLAEFDETMRMLPPSVMHLMISWQETYLTMLVRAPTQPLPLFAHFHLVALGLLFATEDVGKIGANGGKSQRARATSGRRDKIDGRGIVVGALDMAPQPLRNGASFTVKHWHRQGRRERIG